MSLLKSQKIKEFLELICGAIDGSDKMAREKMILGMDFQLTIDGDKEDAEKLFDRMFSNDDDVKHDIKLLRKLSSDLTFTPDQLLE